MQELFDACIWHRIQTRRIAVIEAQCGAIENKQHEFEEKRMDSAEQA